MKRLASFDIFDTCLTRSVADPNDAFWLLKAELQQRGVVAASKFQDSELYSARIRADPLARQRSASQEVTLEEIWAVLAEVLGVPEFAAHWEAELAVERKLLHGVPEVLRRVQAAVQNGMPVVYISDTCMPTWFLQEQLLRCGFPVPQDSIYASSEFKVRKSSGDLFLKVLAARGISAASMEHTGDHPISDGRIPRGLGIKAHVLSASASPFAAEHSLGQAGLPRLVLSGLVKQEQRLGVTDENSAALEGLVRHLVGPALVAFVSWALGEAKRQNLDRLYFMSRDGRLALTVGQILSPAFRGPECRYLYGSRQAIFLPSAAAITPEGMPWLHRYFEQPVLGDLLEKLEIPWERFLAAPGAQAKLASREMVLDGADKWSDFWRLLHGKELTAFLTGKIAERRAAALAYFRAAGLFDGVRWGIVDLGWHAQCQQALTLLLRQVDPALRSVGLYLGLDTERVFMGDCGTAKSLVDRARLLHGVATEEILFRHAELWEHTLGIADHPWVRGYRLAAAGPEPEYREHWPAEQADYFARVEALVRAYAESAVPWAGGLQDEPTARTVVMRCLGRALLTPSPEVVQALSSITATTDQASKKRACLVEPLTIAEACALVCPRRLGSRLGIVGPERLWFQGSLAASPKPIRAVVAGGRLLKAAWRNLRGDSAHLPAC